MPWLELRHLLGMIPSPTEAVVIAAAATTDELLAMWPILAALAGLVGWIAETRYRVSEGKTSAEAEKVKTADALERARRAEESVAQLREWMREAKAQMESLRANDVATGDRMTRMETQIGSIHDDMKEVKGMLRSAISALGSGVRNTAS